jgi:hypothetical protein
VNATFLVLHGDMLAENQVTKVVDLVCAAIALNKYLSLNVRLDG